MRAEPLSPERVVDRVVEVVVARASDADPEGGGWTTVAVDGAPGGGGPELAAEVAARLPEHGHAVLIVSARDFLRPASLRYEYGREDPDVFYDEWLDTKGLLREVFDPLAPGGTGMVLPKLWNTETDRSARAEYVPVPTGSVLLVEGSLLLGRWLPFDVSVHLWLSPAALARRTPAEWAWTLPAYARYEDEVEPARMADLTVRMDDPRHPAVLYG